MQHDTTRRTKPISIPTRCEHVDLRTGEILSTSKSSFMLAPAPEGTCPECAIKHDPGYPHDAASLFYQYRFFGEHGRWPTWNDALAHCEPVTQERWARALAARGIDGITISGPKDYK